MKIRRRSALVIEALEPRLLLSAGPVSQAALQAMHDNLFNVETILKGLETSGDMAHTAPLISASGNTTGGSLSHIHQTFDTDIVSAITAELKKAPSDLSHDLSSSAALVSALSTQVNKIIGTGGGKSVLVEDASTSTLLDIHFKITDQATSSFQLDLGTIGATNGLNLPDQSGNVLQVHTGFDFHAKIDLTALGTAPTDAVAASSFTLSAPTFTTGFHATGDLTGREFDLGILALTIDPSVSTKIDVKGDYTVNLTNTSPVTTPVTPPHIGGTVLRADAAAITGGDFTSLTGSHADFALVGTGTDGTGTALLDLPLLLETAHTISGIDAITTAVHLTVTGHEVGTDYVIATSNLTAAMRTATHNPTLDIASFDTFLPSSIATQLSRVTDYLHTLSGAADLALSIPFAANATIGAVTDIASAFSSLLVGPLQTTVTALGFHEGQANAAAGVLEGVALSASDIASLPSTIALQLTLDNGKLAALKFAPTYLDSNNIATKIASVDNLVTAINQAIRTSPLDGNIEALKDAGAIQFKLDTPSTGIAATKATITSPSGSTIYNNIVDFGVKVASLLKLPGFDDTTLTAGQLTTKLINELGLLYDPITNAITFSISHAFTLPTVTTAFDFNYSLGNVGSLSATNATLDIVPSVLLNLTLGLGLSPLGSDVNQPGGPTIGDGTKGTSDVNLSDIPVVSAASSGGTVPLTANAIAGVASGKADLQIIGREGAVTTIEINPHWTLSNLETAIASAFSFTKLDVTYDAHGKSELDITDSYPAYAGPTPSSVGLTTGSQVSSALVSGSKVNYQAVLPGVAVASPSWGTETKFILTVGQLAPFVVDVLPGATDATSFAAHLNTALGLIAVDPTRLGLDATATLHLSDLVHAGTDTSGGIALSTTISAAIHTITGTDPQISTQRVAVQWGLRVDRVDLTVTALNGSLLPGILGIVGKDGNAIGFATSEIIGKALHGESLADRLLLENTGISATIDVSLVPTDQSKPITVAGSLGPLSFTAPLDPTNVYVSIKASLMLSDASNAVPDVVTLHQLTDSISQGTFLQLWSFTLASGRDGQPFASLGITSVNLAAGSVSLTSAAAPGILITLDDPNVLLGGHAPQPVVSVTGFSSTLAAADIVSAVRQTIDQLDGSLAGTKVPLINVSLDDVLNFTTTFLVALDAGQNDPAGTLAAVQTGINTSLGGNYVTLSVDTKNNIIFHIDYTPLAVTKQLPFNLSLSDLTAQLGRDGGALSSLASVIDGIASASATGTLDVSAGATLALTLGINLGANDLPATLATPLSTLNSGKGLRNGTAGQPGLQVTLGNGKAFTVDVSTLTANATVQNLLDLLNSTAAQNGVAGFASLDAATGKLTLTDTTANPAAGLSALHLASVTGVETASAYSLTGTSKLTDADAAKAYSFNVAVGRGVTAEVDVAADATRTTVKALVSAIRAAINDTTVSATALAHENVVLPGSAGSTPAKDYNISLGQIVTVATDTSGDLVLSAKKSVLGTDNNHNLINTLALSEATPKLSFSVVSINSSHIASALGLASDSASTTSAGATRTLTGSLMQAATASDRFFLKTGNDTNGHLLTGITATVGVSGQKLNFTAGIGPLSGKIVDGTATLGADLGGVVASDPNFAVGGATSGPAKFTIGLNDNFGGATAGAGILTFSNLSKLGTTGNTLSNLIHLDENAALSMNLPVVVYGQAVGPISLKIGNLFNDTNLALPARSIVTSFPDFSKISFTSILNDPQTLIDGLDALLSTLSGGTFAQKIYSLDLPLIGPALRDIGSFFTTLHNDVIGTLQSELNAFKAANPGAPATTQNIVTVGLNDVLGYLHIPGKIYSYIDSIANPTELSFVWHFDVELLNKSVNLTSDLGIPGLGLSLQNGVATIQADLSATLAFGIIKGKGFFVYDMGTSEAVSNFTSNNDPAHVFMANFQTTHALDLGVAVSLASNFTASLNVGFLTAIATNGSMLTATAVGMTFTGTSLTGDLIADIGPDETTGRLLFSKFGSTTVVRAYVATTLNVDLAINTGIGIGSVDSAFPSITTEILFSYSFDKSILGKLPTGMASGVITPVTFEHVSLDIGEFLTKFLKPILDDLHQVTGPIQPFLDFLTAPIPGISQIIGNTSVLDLAEQFGTPGIKSAAKFIEVVDEVSTLINTLDALANSGNGKIVIDFGTYVLGATHDSTAISISGTTVDPFASKTAVKSVDTTAAVASLAGASASAAANKLNGINAGGKNVGSQLSALQQPNGAGGKPVIDFPILHDPMAILGLVMGKISPVDLVHVTLPTFNFSVTENLEFDFVIVVVPVEVTFYMTVGVQINLAFGFDTTGIIHYQTSHKALDILDGFYIDNTIGPQLKFSATFGVQAGIDLVLVQAGIGGEVTGTIAFQLHDPSGTGKIHLSVLLDELLSNPLNMFDISGALTARIYAFYWVGVDIAGFKVTLVQGQFDIINVTLLSFSYSYADAHSTPQLAHETGSNLALNIGANADRQEAGGNLYNPNQSFTVTGIAPGTVGVSGNGTSTDYTGVGKISANVGDGNNSLSFANLHNDVSIGGGSGNNKIDLSGVLSDPVITLGDGNNIIFGAQIDTTITLGNGNNTIYGGKGRLTITAGEGRNTIVGGPADDVILVGGGDNTIWGGDGNDTITAGGGNNTIWGGKGNDVIAIQNGAGTNIIFGNGPQGPTAASTTTITSTQISDDAASTDDGNKTITGGNGRDYIFGGGGSSTIVGNAGQDVLIGSTGTVSLDGSGGIVKVTATSLIGGSNTITGGGGDSIIIGGVGSNTINAGSGNSIVVGNLGTVDGPQGGSGGLFTTTAQIGVGGSDLITLGTGTDVVVAGIGANTIHAGAGNDIIVAHEGIVVRDGASGRTTNLVSVHTTDETSGGNVLVDSGTGNDFILGGAGNNVIHQGRADGSGGAGLSVLIGNFGTIQTSALTPSQTSAYQALTITSVDGAAAGHGNNTITTDNTAIIMGGGGNNSVTTTEGVLAEIIVFGANGQVVADTLLAGGITLHTAQTLQGEELVGGNNIVSVAAGHDVVIAGAGNSTVTAGDGIDVILGHIGFVSYDRLAAPDHTGLTPDVIGTTRGQNGVALSTTGTKITAGNGQDVIIGGAGNNTIIAGTGIDIVIGAGGMVTRDGLAGKALLMAQSTEESLGGNNTITVGLGGTSNDVVIAGIGHNTITAGNGNNVILGHIGIVNFANFASFTTVQRYDGSRPDVLGRYLPEIGAQTAGAPTTPGLDVLPSGGGSLITLGSGNNVIIGGLGDNAINAGQGNNVVFGAAGSVTRDATTLSLVFATTIEEQFGGNNTIAVTSGQNVVFGGIGNNLIIAGERANVLLGHLGQVSYAAQTQFTAAQRADGSHPDVIGRSLPELGNRSPNTAAGNAGLDTPVVGTSSTIYAGNGNNVIMGGAGNNTIVAGLGLNVIFGAAGSLTRNPLSQSVVYASTVEEAIGGNNIITAGLRGLVGDIVFGGIGTNIITVGGGNNIVLGHLGVVNTTALTTFTAAQRADGSHPDIFARLLPELGGVSPNGRASQTGLNTVFPTGNDTIYAGNGNNVIIGGGGNNTITAGAGTDVVFGAGGAVTRNSRTGSVVVAQTVEESLGGNDTITVGIGSRNNGSTIFGGAGTNVINVGGGTNVVLGHLGTVNTTGYTTLTTAQRADGTHPDIISRSIPVAGNVLPVTSNSASGPFSGLGQPLPVAGGTITAGNGNNIILGGAGVNTITAGNGRNVIFGASGVVTRSATPGVGTIVAKTIENTVGGSDSITVGTGTDLVFGGVGSNTISTLGTSDLLFSHTGQVFLIAGSQTLASGNGLAALATAASNRAQALPAPVSPASSAAKPGGTTFILDASHGYWVADNPSAGGPLLILDGVDAPELVLDVSAPISVAGTISAAA